MPELVSIGKLAKKSKVVQIKIMRDYVKGLKGLSACSHAHFVCVSQKGKLGILIVNIIEMNEKIGEIKGYLPDEASFLKEEYPLDVIDIKPYFPCEDYASKAKQSGNQRIAKVRYKENKKYEMDFVGEIRNTNNHVYLSLNQLPEEIGEYIKVLWWFDRFDDKKFRHTLLCNPPYETTNKIGIFASRSPVRINPIAVTVARVKRVDWEKNRIYISEIEGYDHTPLLGILDYDSNLDKIESVEVPEWAKDWPKCMDMEKQTENELTTKIHQYDKKAEKVFTECSIYKMTTYEETSIETPTCIEVKGARENNLKGINVVIPYNKITAVVGVSGSGKSSLVVDTVYAECKRRMEYLNSENMGYKRPEIKDMTGCIPTVRITQKEISSNINSTIGTYTSLYRHLRTIYATIGESHYEDASKVKLKITPSTFSYMDPECRCAKCNGTGIVYTVDENKIITDEDKSLLEGASPFLGKLKTYIANPNANWMKGQVVALANQMGVDLSISWKELPEEFKHIVMNGDKSREVSFIYDNQKNGRKGEITRTVEGIIPTIHRLYIEDSNESIVEKFMIRRVCDACDGERLAPFGRLVTLEGLRYPKSANMTFEQLYGFTFFLENRLKAETFRLIEEHLKAIRKICNVAFQLGIGYLNVDRKTNEMSGGEAQRLKLMSAFLNHMTGILYIFDEPSKKLGIHEYKYIINLMKNLVADGNTILMVEHNIDLIKIADYIIEIGPKPGVQGGYLVGEGSYEDVIHHNATMLSEKEKHELRKRDCVTKNLEKVCVNNVTANNLKNVSISFNKRQLTCITGPSGSGKSTLMYHGIIPQFSHSKEFEEVVVVESKTSSGSSRSIIATYIGIMDEIREMFANTNDALERKMTAKDFSFNAGRGRCDCCNGEGRIKIPYTKDSYCICPECQGTRYKKEFEEIKLAKKSISDILKLSVEEAIEFFQEKHENIRKKCAMLSKVGLGYLSLGHSTNMLSGGEMTRLKIGSCLMDTNMKNTLFLFDEPTCGLHFSDIDHLISILYELIDRGNTVVAIEHNKRFLSAADEVITMHS